MLRFSFYFASKECFDDNQALRTFSCDGKTFVSSNITSLHNGRLIRLGTRLKVKLYVFVFFSSTSRDDAFFARSNCCPITVNISLFFAFLFRVSYSAATRRKRNKLRDISLHNNKKFMIKGEKERSKKSLASLSLHRYGNHELYNE